MNVFSTCWNSKRHEDGGAMCDEILSLGFDTIEASHGLPLTMLPGLVRAVDEKRIRVAGVHNFCPAPIEIQGDAPDAYRFTSHRPEQRARALRLTQESLRTAARLGARYVVLHLGTVEIMKRREGTRLLERMARNGQLGSPAYLKFKGQLVRRRERLGSLYCDRAHEALHSLAEEARELGLVLAVEGRSHMEQVPGESEMLQLMAEFRDTPHVRYWHDFGHIQRKHNLLLPDPEQDLEALSPSLPASHTNDAQ